MTGYPPKCPQNGSRDITDTDPHTADPWPGDTFTDWAGRVWTYQSDGSGWTHEPARAKESA